MNPARDPAAALALFQDFIEANGAWFERADDSSGMLGETVRSACRHWLLAESLRDPDVTVRALLRYRPDPNPVQRQSFARAYLEAGRPMRWSGCRTTGQLRVQPARAAGRGPGAARSIRGEHGDPAASCLWPGRCGTMTARAARPSSTA